VKDSLGANAIASGVQAIATAAILFVTYRFLVRTLSTEQFGLWALIASIAAVARLGDFGLGASLSRFVAVELATGQRRAAASLVQSSTLAVTLLAGSFALLLYGPLLSLLPRIVPPGSLEEGRALLPYMLASLVLLVVGLTLGGALEGCQRFVQRAIVGIAGSLTLLVAALVLVPGRGVVGVGMAQVAQAIVVVALAWLLARRELAISSLLPARLVLADLRKVWKFGLGVQAISLTQLLVEPLAKILMTRFGGLSATGLFELAYRVSTQLRAPLVAACQVMLPAMAATDPADRGAMRQIHARAMTRLRPLSLLAFGALLLAWPLVSWFLVGHVDSFLVGTGVLLTLAWFVNTLSAPAYFTLLGQGAARWNLLGHVVTGLLTAMLCSLLGRWYGGAGVSVGYAIAIAAGSMVVILVCRGRLAEDGR
jgi:O-antigen/teichoic acid export membrane protein